MGRLTTRDRALDLAASIIEARAAEVERGYVKWRTKYPDDALGAATEPSAYLECVLLARLIRERMSPAGRLTLSQEGSDA